MLVKSQPWNLKITVKTQKNFQKNTISIHLFIFNPKLKVKTLQTHTHRNTWHSKPTSTPNASQDHHTSNLSMTHHSWLRPPHQIQPMAHNVNHQLNHRNPTHHNCNNPQQNRNPKTQPPQLNQTNPPPQPDVRERERERERDEIKKNKSKLATCYNELLLVAVHSSTLSYFFRFSSSYIICFLAFGVQK